MKVGFQVRRRANNFQLLIAFVWLYETKSLNDTVGVFVQFQTRNRALLFRKRLHVPW